VQIEGPLESPPEHSHPSIEAVHKELHMDSLLIFPSSQNSGPIFKESPQIGEQMEGFEISPPLQDQPEFTPLQLERHPKTLKG